MQCCHQEEHKGHEEKKEVQQSSVDRILTYILVGLVAATLVVGYLVVSNKNKSQATNQKSASVDEMSSHHGGNRKFTPLPQGSIAPNFRLPSTAGTTVSLANYKGKHVLLFFNEGVMCSPCWQEISRLERFKNDFASLNTVLIPISVDDRKTWDPILKEEKIATPILIDADRKVTAAYKSLGTPSSMHSDRAGHTYVHINTDGKIHSSADFPNMSVETKILMDHIRQAQNSHVKTQS